MSKGISGAALRHWITEVNPNITELQKRLEMPARTFYDMNQRKNIRWAMVAKIHGILREEYVYDDYGFNRWVVVDGVHCSTNVVAM